VCSSLFLSFLVVIYSDSLLEDGTGSKDNDITSYSWARKQHVLLGPR
jgi:hypothetical protein